MNEKFSAALSSFMNNSMAAIKKFADWFAKDVTVSIMNNDKSALEELCEDAVSLYSDIEFNRPIKKNKEYYFGYFTAYLNISQRLMEEKEKEYNIELAVSRDDRLRQIICFLGENKFGQHNEIVAHLKLTASGLTNFFNKPIIKQLGIFNVQKIGKNVIYSLTQRGKEYYHTQTTESDKKIFNKKQILELFSLIIKHPEKDQLDELHRQSPILDKDLLKELYQLANSKFQQRERLLYVLTSKKFASQQYHADNNEYSLPAC